MSSSNYRSFIVADVGAAKIEEAKRSSCGCESEGVRQTLLGLIAWGVEMWSRIIDWLDRLPWTVGMEKLCDLIEEAGPLIWYCGVGADIELYKLPPLFFSDLISFRVNRIAIHMIGPS